MAAASKKTYKALHTIAPYHAEHKAPTQLYLEVSSNSFFSILFPQEKKLLLISFHGKKKNPLTAGKASAKSYENNHKPGSSLIT